MGKDSQESPDASCQREKLASQMAPLSEDHAISPRITVPSLGCSSGDPKPTPIAPRLPGAQRDPRSLYLTPVCPWAPPSWSHRGAAWDPRRCTRAHRS